MFIIVQPQAWQCSKSKYWKTSRFQNIHKMGELIKTICPDTKHKNLRKIILFELLQLLALGWDDFFPWIYILHNLTKQDFSWWEYEMWCQSKFSTLGGVIVNKVKGLLLRDTVHMWHLQVGQGNSEERGKGYSFETVTLFRNLTP